MQLRQISKKGNKLRIRVREEGHTFCNLIRRALWKTNQIKTAGYYIEHPQVGQPILTVDAKSEPKKILAKAAADTKAMLDALKKEIEKI
ncbi:hypothetical protein CL622_08375 [archaeon]|nr:hypothetical protein [archaeon]|tara:strand:- start:926 stop:1192 length:267 start_codon:yes stop_codon:yes gene_type:complete